METTRAYYMSHVLLRNKIFFEPDEFGKKLSEGPNSMKQYLKDLWQSIDQKLFKEGVIIKDIDRKAEIEDFDITNAMVGDKNIFFFQMPEPDSYDTQAKCIALVLERGGKVRYITMEIWTQRESEIIKEIKGSEAMPQYTIGEWIFVGNDFEHKNLGKVKEDSIDSFASAVAQIVIG
ncbi:MAG: hypothetical protein J6M60_01060 [Clostridia bacterium]|nr:hypothetical protein [Clostridia bacterium]